MIIHSLVGIWVVSIFGCCVNNATVNICIQVSVWISVFTSFGYILRNRIYGSYSSCIFKFWRSHHTVFYSGYTILLFHQQCVRVLVSPHSHPHLLFSVCLFLNSHLNRCEVIPCYGFWFAFPLWRVMLAIFSCAY